jgi:predicted nuclease of predicted toxin-antitoxin system
LTLFVLDECIPKKTKDILEENGVELVSISGVSPGVSDELVIEYANKVKGVIVTFDLDFGALIFKERRLVTGLMLLRLTPSSPEYIAERIMHTISQVSGLEGKLVVIEEKRIRVTSL